MAKGQCLVCERRCPFVRVWPSVTAYNSICVKALLLNLLFHFPAREGKIAPLEGWSRGVRIKKKINSTVHCFNFQRECISSSNAHCRSDCEILFLCTFSSPFCHRLYSRCLLFSSLGVSSDKSTGISFHHFCSINVLPSLPLLSRISCYLSHICALRATRAQESAINFRSLRNSPLSLSRVTLLLLR